MPQSSTTPLLTVRDVKQVLRGSCGRAGCVLPAPVRCMGSLVRTAPGSRPSSRCWPVDAKAAGIAVIYQEPTLFPGLSVAENIAMSRHSRWPGSAPSTVLR